MGDAVMAFVELGDGDDGELEMAALDRTAGAQLEQQPHQMRHRRGRMGEDRHLVAEGAVAGDETLVDRSRLRRQLGGTDIAHPRHLASFTQAEVFGCYYAESGAQRQADWGATGSWPIGWSAANTAMQPSPRWRRGRKRSVSAPSLPTRRRTRCGPRAPGPRSTTR